ncbi:MAG: hypothetical protein AB8G18_01335 [Gammaproteobacteria bacterium]
MNALPADVYLKREGVDETLGTRQTESKLSLALDAIVNDKNHAEKSAGSYLDVLHRELSNLTVVEQRESIFDARILSTIDASREYVNEYRFFVIAVSKAQNTERFLPQFTHFLERVLEIKKNYELEKTAAYLWLDSISFITREIFLSTIGPLCAGGHWALVNGLLTHSYTIAKSNRTFSYHAFDGFQRSLDVFRNRRLNLKRLSVSADVLKERADGSSLEFEQIMQADFILHVYSLVHDQSSRKIWFARTLGYADKQLVSGFDAFVAARAGSSDDFLETLFEVADWTQLQSCITEAANSAALNFSDTLDYQGYTAANTAVFDQ